MEMDRVHPKDRLVLARLLRYIASHVYDLGHGLLPQHQWVLDVVPFMDFLAQESGLDSKELGWAYDRTRFQVVWERLAEEGFCDAWDSKASQRVLLEWWRTDRIEIESFIREQVKP